MLRLLLDGPNFYDPTTGRFPGQAMELHPVEVVKMTFQGQDIILCLFSRGIFKDNYTGNRIFGWAVAAEAAIFTVEGQPVSATKNEILFLVTSTIEMPAKIVMSTNADERTVVALRAVAPDQERDLYADYDGWLLRRGVMEAIDMYWITPGAIPGFSAIEVEILPESV